MLPNAIRAAEAMGFDRTGLQNKVVRQRYRELELSADGLAIENMADQIVSHKKVAALSMAIKAFVEKRELVDVLEEASKKGKIKIVNPEILTVNTPKPKSEPSATQPTQSQKRSEWSSRVKLALEEDFSLDYPAY